MHGFYLIACVLMLCARQPFTQTLTTITRAVPGEWSIYIEDLRGGGIVEMRSDVVVHPASTIKLVIATQVLWWLERHPETHLYDTPTGEERTLAELLQAMLVDSEERAANALERFLKTRADYDREQLSEWGLRDTVLSPRRTTARDLGVLLKRLYGGGLLNAESTRLLFKLLRQPSPDDKLRLGGGVRAAVRARLAHKTGTLFQGGWGVVADAGIFNGDDYAYVVVVLSNHVDWVNFDKAMRVIQRISSAVYWEMIPKDECVGAKRRC